jgi:DNA-binding SARP family transcriptional activator/predicted ATPase
LLLPLTVLFVSGALPILFCVIIANDRFQIVAKSIVLHISSDFMALFSIQLFGTFQVAVGGTPVNGFRSDKVRALLAYLAVEANRSHRRDALAGLLWPEMPETKAHDNLRLALHRLRQALSLAGAFPEQFFEITPKTIQFKCGDEALVDVLAFSRLLAESHSHRHSRTESCVACVRRRMQAAALYHGDLLQGFFVDSQPFDEWLTVQREALRFQALETLYLLAAYYEETGDFAQAQRFARWQLEMDAWREDAHRQLMRSLALAGQRSEALAQYEACARMLEENLGVEPDDETQELYQHILSGVKALPSNLELSEKTLSAAKRAMPSFLPSVPSTPLAGRQDEMAQISAFLENPRARLLTLAGPGGVGKTRLALQAAWEWRGSFPQGVCFIPLAGVDTPDLLLPAIAEGLEFASHAGEDFKAQLLNYLRGKEMLLVLDNFEHLLVAADAVIEILSQAVGVKILATSRQRLGLENEQVIELAGLDYPIAAGSGEADAEAEACSAVQLFVNSATRLGWRPAENHLPAIIRICQLVEGLPLALELAAAWTRVLLPAEIAYEIERDLGFLAASHPEVPERQRSLRVVYAASWNLLSEEERRVWQGLSVFRGGFLLDAARQIAGASPHVLVALLDKSLLRRGADGRFEIHELLRQFAAEKLIASPDECQTIGARHAAFYLEFICQRKAALEDAFCRGQRPVEFLVEIDQEIDNLRTSTNKLFGPGYSDFPGDEEIIQAYVDGLGLFYEYQGWPQEMRRLYEQALAWVETLPGQRISPALRADWFFHLGKACMGLGQITSSRTSLEQALAEWGIRMPGSPGKAAFALLTQMITQASHRLVSWFAPAHRLRASGKSDLALSHIFEQYAEISYLTGERPFSLYCALRTLNLAERLGPSPEMARASANVCLGAGIVGLHSLADVYSNQARRALHSLCDALTQAYVLQVTGIYDLTRARWQNALQSLEQAAGLYQRLGHQHQWGMCTMPRFVILHSQGKLALAQDLLQGLGDAAQSSGDLILKTWELLGQALIDLESGKTEQVIACIEASLKIHRETAYPTRVMMAYALLSIARLRQGEAWLARQAADDAIGQITRSSHTVFTSSVGFSAAADTYLRLYEQSDPGDVAERQYFLRQIRRLLEAMHLQTRAIPASQSYYWLRLGSYRWLSGAHPQAFAAWEKGLQAAERFHLLLEQGRVHLEIGRHRKPGDPDRQAHLQQACQLFEEMGAVFNLLQAQAEMNRQS